jgi:carboxypeptidase Taq
MFAMTNPYALLLDHTRETALLSTSAAVLHWDQEVMLPPGGAEWRSRQLSLLARLAHERSTAPEVGAWLAACEADSTLAAAAADDLAAANVRELRRDYDRATRLPSSLVAELAAAESLAQHVWAEARAESDFARLRPHLEKLVGLQRDKARCLSLDRGEPWDALADGFEPGMNQKDLAALFAPLRQELVALIAGLGDRGTPPPTAFVQIAFPPAHQEAFVRAVLTAMGFDFARGRLDRSAHPFCTGLGGDVRLTTRFHRANVLDALGSTMHEGGHGLYEQGLAVEHLGTPLGEAVSLGVHESQSRLWENQVGRSRAFWQWCRPLARQHLGAWVDAFPAPELFRCANRVQPSLIRVEADEATYNLHVMVRFQLEVALLRGELPVGELPAAWNDAYRDLLGVEVPDDRRGCLQDVHWSCGLFGYFPTYTLGNLYAAQFFAAAERQLGELEPAFARGDFAPLREWLRTHVHQHGRRFTPDELCRRVTGAPLSSRPFLSYLETKLRAVYEV